MTNPTEMRALAERLGRAASVPFTTMPASGWTLPHGETRGLLTEAAQALRDAADREERLTADRNAARNWAENTTEIEHQLEAAEAALAVAREGLRPLIKVHAGAEVTRRLLVDGIEYFKSDSRVVVYLRDTLDALDGGSRKKGLLAMGDTPDERIAKGRATLAKLDELGSGTQSASGAYGSAAPLDELGKEKP